MPHRKPGLSRPNGHPFVKQSNQVNGTLIIGMGVSVRRKVQISTCHGPLRLVSFWGLPDGKEHVAILFGNPDASDNPCVPLVRVHSECFTADLCESLHCECGPQRTEANRLCREEGCGVIIHMRDEGRGIGLYAKLDAYHLQIEEGLDTFQANEALGFPADARDFTIAADMLKALGITTIRLLTNNPAKIEALVNAGITVEKVVPTGVHVTPENRSYLEAKVRVTNHALDLNDEQEGH